MSFTFFISNFQRVWWFNWFISGLALCTFGHPPAINRINGLVHEFTNVLAPVDKFRITYIQ